MSANCRLRLYKDKALSEPNRPIWSAIKKIGKHRFLVLGQFELYSKSDGGLFLEFFRIGKGNNDYNRGKLETLKRRKKATDPHLFGCLKILDKTFTAAAWICRDENQKYFHLTLLKIKEAAHAEGGAFKSSK
ncbi:hypothetical protein SAMN05444000_1094 [Shimia gijangensis]|uniref:Uncharacterized protein n=1 Tax=Shimia gijangensis TaxID=1470563 RepID=A0A1M6JF97_9RHOB|nr:hypothetical protein [Shimia gijangensis]SHJ45302.1 hypothetical protein SAMN05444000_1094 [Shimia gijangensis]